MPHVGLEGLRRIVIYKATDANLLRANQRIVIVRSQARPWSNGSRRYIARIWLQVGSVLLLGHEQHPEPSVMEHALCNPRKHSQACTQYSE